ncbi:hypothetical protein [Streptomyces sp. NPDC003697]
MSADEVFGAGVAAAAQGSTGPRHAAPRKPLFTRFHVPPGKAIAMAAMPTAVLMAMGFTPTLALADNNPSASSSNSLTAEEYKACVAALEGSGDEASASPSPSASASATGEDDGKDTAEPAPSATSSTGKPSAGGASGTSSSDSGSDDKASRASTPGSGTPAGSDSTADTSGGETASPSPSPSRSGSGGLLGTVGDALTDIVTGGHNPDAQSGTSAPAAPAPSASPSATATADAPSDSPDRSATDPAGDTADKAAGTAKDTAKDTAGKAAGAAEDAADGATASPSPSASATVNAEDCKAATDAEGGVDNRILVPDDPWELQASSLLLKGAQYKGVVEVRTASGATKKVLKYVVTDGTDIGDLHQLVRDKNSGKTYHVQAARGSTSTIREGDTVMYTESISGNLLGLIPVTFSPDSPPPLDIPLIYFTKVKVVQAGQFGGSLHIPGLHQFTTD